jgi:hypothetical protein
MRQSFYSHHNSILDVLTAVYFSLFNQFHSFSLLSTTLVVLFRMESTNGGDSSDNMDLMPIHGYLVNSMLKAIDIVSSINSMQEEIDFIDSLLNRISTDGSDADIIRSLNKIHSRVELIIHHQLPGVELVSPVYASNNAACYLLPDQRVDVGFTTQADFDVYFLGRDPVGILTYKLQKKNIDQSDGEVISSEDESRCIQLFIIWKIDSLKRFLAIPYLLEHDRDRVWDRDSLIKLANYYGLIYMQHGLIKLTYLMHDNTVLMTSLNAIYKERCYKLKLTITEGSIKDDTIRPQYIGLDRRVSIMILVTMFTY